MKLTGTLLLLGLSFNVLAQGTQPQPTAGLSTSVSLDVTNVNANILTGGDFFDGLGSNHFEVPRGSGKNTIYAGALWLGGKDQQNNLYVSSQTYRQFSPPQAGYWPGPIGNIMGQAHSATYDKVWKVSKAQIQNHIANYSNPSYSIPADIASWPGNGNSTNGEAAQLAPYVDLNNDGVYSPMQGDYPKISGDQAIYLILNDKGNTKVPASPAMNAEIHVMFYGYNNPADTAVYNTVFSKYRLINRGTNNFKDVYAGIWTDLDIGFYNDDYIGCDVQTDSYFGYNGDGFDETANGYGATPPVQSVIFLDQKMSNFMSYRNDNNPTFGNPVTALHYYNFLTGKWKNSTPITYGLDGTGPNQQPYRFMYPGLSDTLGYGFGYTPAAPGSPANPPIVPPFQNWTEYNRDGNGGQNTPSDRRGLGSIGPFNLAAGQELEFSVAYNFSRGNAHRDVQTVRNFFRNGVIAGTKPEQLKQPLVLFPNPATDQLTIQLPDNFENRETSIVITDYTGREVLKTNAANQNGKNLQLNIATLSKGIYQISVVSGSQRISSRLVKM
jgi:hypothetical protein